MCRAGAMTMLNYTTIMKLPVYSFDQEQESAAIRPYGRSFRKNVLLADLQTSYVLN